MKLFKKALLATAIFGAMGAQAATVSSDPLKLSAEGVAAGLTAENVAFDVDFVVKKLTPAASTVTLTFDDAVDLSDLETLVGTTAVDITNDPATGTGVIDSAGDGSGTVYLTFSYGTGSFTFDRLVVDADAGTISFEVNLGNPITAESAFRLSASVDAGVDFSGASQIAYASEESDGTAIETGVGTLATTTSQFDFAVTAPFDGRIERVAQTTFAKNGNNLTVSDAAYDTLGYYLVDNADNLEASLIVTSATVELEGDFDNGVTGSPVVGGDPATVGQFTPAATFSTSQDSLTFTAVTPTTDGAKTAGTLVFDNTTNTTVVIPQTGDIAASATLAVSNGSAATLEIATNVDAGEWALDALVINIPYFPVGFEGLSTSVHFANESANDADVIVTAIDQAGNEYDGTIADLAGDTVTKVSQVAIMEALGAPAGSKLSVTFNINANDGDVNAYAFSNAGTGRQALVTSQEKGIK
ncbi:hypothetical protein EXT42_14640 [Pseudoalteromonas sp. CO302Y]|uniref:hypothetical protein n=1 Tax=unclassified Pseudoalteromonas TaxID=194690 RepID=UPI0010232678|nr:hypothetical protein EXT42_14640 [Pseudoalteromonas sp. CO302Y]RZG07069.1 hypothetical protein EXT40_15420 [Pseudoalteromonas sp. CO133X]